MTDKEKLEAIRAEIHRLVDVRGYDREMANDLFAFMDSLEEDELTKDEQKVSNAYCRKIRDKRDLPILKGESKHKFINEFNTLYQTLDMQLCDRCMKEPLKDLCLAFATWGAYNLKHIGGISKEETTKMDSLEEEPVSKDYRERYKRIAQSESFKEAYDGKSISEEEHSEIDFEQELYKAFGQVKDFTLGMRIAKWFYNMGKNSQEPVSEDLETDIAIRLGGVCHKQVWHKNHFSKENCKAHCSLYKECQECSIDLCMIFFHDPHCHFEEEPVSEDLENAGKEWLRPQLDKYYKPYGEGKMMELTRFDGYAMLDAIEFGAKWQKQQDQSTIELAEDHAMLAGMEKMKEQMMKDAEDLVVGIDANGLACVNIDGVLPDDTVRVLVIKED